MNARDLLNGFPTMCHGFTRIEVSSGVLVGKQNAMPMSTASHHQ
jgi:hypothetical protein